MPERDSDFFEVLVSQIAENARINVVVGKTLSVLPEAKCIEPVRNRLHGGHRLFRCDLKEPALYPVLFSVARHVRGHRAVLQALDASRASST